MIELTGLDEMRARLKMLDEQVRTEFVKKAVKAGSHVIAEAMQEAAPVLAEKSAGSDALEPGTLREDIKVRIHKDMDGFVSAWIGPGNKTQHVARFVEYGHRNIRRSAKGKERLHSGGGGKGTVSARHPDTPAYPFLRPAFDRTEDEAIRVFKETMRDEIAGALS